MLKGFFLVALLLSSSAYASEKIRVAAASDLKFAMDEIKPAFVKLKPGVELDVTIGSSGQFTQQIEGGANFDLFLSADRSYPDRLKEKSFTSGDVFNYGKGHLVLWARNDKGLDVTSGLQTLTNPKIKKIAIANPAHAPYGKSAKDALDKSGVYAKIETKLVTGDSITQAAQFALTGAADVGLIALSLALSPEFKKVGNYDPVKEAPELIQAGVVLKSNKAGAAALRDFILSADGQAILAKYGLK